MIHKRISYRRHQRERVIRKRTNIFKNVWHENLEESGHTWDKPGFYDKTHLGCSCWMCSKSDKTKNAGNKISEQRKILREQDIEQ